MVSPILLLTFGSVEAKASQASASFTETLDVQNISATAPHGHSATGESAVFDRIHQNISSEMLNSPGAKCPFLGTRIEGVEGTGPTLDFWYPERLRVEVLNNPSERADPYGPSFNYTDAFLSLNYTELKQDLNDWLTTEQEWWPADYGNYGPQQVRTTWHSAGTYRIFDGRGGLGHALQRFLPINSWTDNANTDKTRRLLWPIKQKYGDKLTWADLIALAGNVALENMGVHTVGFGGGRNDAWQVDAETYWGSEKMMLGRKRWEHGNSSSNSTTDLANPFANSENGLIYVNPEGPAGNPDPYKSAMEVRTTFSRMAMSDEETVALIAGGHSFGKSHGGVPQSNVGPPPENASIEYQGLGWINSYRSGNAEYTTTNGIEGSWIQSPLQWNKEYLYNLLDNNWTTTHSPAGSVQWRPTSLTDNNTTPDAHIPGKRNPIMMMTSDVALKVDPSYNKILRHFRDSNETVFFTAFAEAWYKLIHRDMGPHNRLFGPEVPKEPRIWQDPIPERDYEVINSTDVTQLKALILNSTKLNPVEFARAAWASASTHRVSDHRGGANGARISLEPQVNWEVNRPDQLKKVLSELKTIQKNFNKTVSLADLIVLAGSAAIEKAVHNGGFANLTVPFTPGRMDAYANQTDVPTFEWLHPVMDGFRNFETGNFTTPAEFFLIDRAHLLGLSSPQLTALIGGARAINLNWDDSQLGVFTHKNNTLSNDFFVNLLDMRTKWIPLDDEKTRFEGVNRANGTHEWYATRTDLIFGHNDQLRADAEVYAGNNTRFVHDFISAWNYVMNLDRYDINMYESGISSLPAQ